jgi:putative radical SAM enzyme (TIGR03279 family)
VTTYGTPRPARGTGGRIVAVAEASPAARAGLLAGDIVRALDGEPVADVFDWQWRADGDQAALTIERRGEDLAVTLGRDEAEPWGIDFADLVFDGVRTCRNDCAFCFMSQLPRGLRPALYLRDDDFRLSFAEGTFITLTNLTDDDVERIVEQRLSPQHVSLHAVDAEVRRALVACRDDDRALERFDELVEGGVDLHVQVVLVPGVNDGAVLDETLTWLAQREGVASIGIVPLGYSRFQDRFDRSYNDPADAAAVIDQVAPWADAFRERDGIAAVYLADEFYLAAGRPLPEADDYDGYPQFENGIGMVRAFIDEWADEAAPDAPTGATVVTGELFAPVLTELLGERATVLAVPNRLFGGNVTVTGLLGGDDIAEAITADGGAGPYLVPDVTLNADGVFLDDVTPMQLLERTAADVRVVSSDARGLAVALSRTTL